MKVVVRGLYEYLTAMLRDDRAAMDRAAEGRDDEPHSSVDRGDVAQPGNEEEEE